MNMCVRVETKWVRIRELTRAFRVSVKKAIQKARGSNFKYVSNITIIELLFSVSELGSALALGVLKRFFAVYR